MATMISTNDVGARELSDALRLMADTMLPQDREIATILRAAQHDLERLAWNRYAAHMTRQSARRAFRRHHKALMPLRTGM